MLMRHHLALFRQPVVNTVGPPVAIELLPGPLSAWLRLAYSCLRQRWMSYKSRTFGQVSYPTCSHSQRLWLTSTCTC